MKNKLLHFLEDMSPQARSAFLIGLTVAVINFIAAPYLLYIGLSTNAPQFYMLAALVWVQSLTAGFGTILSRRGNPTAGILLILWVFIVGYPYSATLVSGFATVTGIALVVAGPIAAFSVLPRRSAWGMAIISIVSGLAAIFLDIFGPETRPSLPGIVIPALAVLTVSIIGYLIVRQAWRGNIRVKLVTSFTIVALVSTGIVSAVVYNSYKNQVREDIRQRLLNITSISAIQLDGDLHATLRTAEDMQTEAYKQMLAQGDEIVATDPDLIYAYTMRKNEQGQIYFVIDARRADDTERDALGTIYDEPSETLQAYFNAPDRPIVEKEIYTDKYGSVLSAFAPFYRADGSLEGIWGVDIAADKIIAKEQAVLRLIVGATVAAMIIVTLLGLFLGNLFTRPILNLSSAAQKITEGDLDARARIETTDEIGDLATAFNKMTSQLQETLQGLEARVAARTQDLAIVAEVGTATATILETDKLLQAVVDLTKERFNLYHSHIYLLDEAAENLVLASGAGEVGRQMVAEKRSIPLSREQSLVARAAREHKGVTVNDVTQAPDFLPNPLLPDTRSELAVPMIVGGKVIGVFDIQSDQVERFTESDVNIQTTLAAQVATSVQNVHSFEQSKSQADLESLVNAIGQKIQRATTVEDTLQTAIREVGLALGAARVSANIGTSRQHDGDEFSRN